MTKEDLYAAWKSKIASSDIVKIKHKNMRTVEFYPMSYEENTHHRFTGYWICIQLNAPLVQDTIKIKHEDLQHWSIVED